MIHGFDTQKPVEYPALACKEKEMEKQAGAMTTAGKSNGGAHTWSAWCPCCVLCVWALLIRLMAAGKVFPAQGDASHFVQHGKAFVAMGMDGISGYWSLLPQFIAAWSVKMGLMPQYVLQAMTVGFGVLLVAGVYAFALELGRSRTIAFVAGLLIATNPVLTASSTSGLAETPHMALATWSLVLAFAGARKGSVWRFALAGAVAAVDMYYRPYDLFLYVAGAAPFVLWRMRMYGWWKGVRMATAGVVIGVVCSLPFFAITTMKSADSVGTSKLVNLAFRKHGLDAKAMFAAKGLHGDEVALSLEIRELQEKGAARYLWNHKGEIARDYMRNVAKGIRHLNGHAFEGMFRMGFFWFVLIGGLSVVAAWSSGRGEMALYALVAMGVILGALSIGFVHPRWVMQFLPFYVLLAGMGFEWLAEHIPAGWMNRATWCILLAAGLLNSRWAVARLDDEWRQRNLFAARERLAKHMDEGEKLMSFRPELPALFYATNTLAWMAIPYGPVDEVFAWADMQGVDCIVLNSSTFPHFPIHEIERNPGLIPLPWKEIDRVEFAQDTRFGEERDEFRIYRRSGEEAGLRPEAGDEE